MTHHLYGFPLLGYYALHAWAGTSPYMFSNEYGPSLFASLLQQFPSGRCYLTT